MICAFANVYHEFGWPPCSSAIHRHHVISRHKLHGNRKAFSLVENKYRKVFIADVCSVHNVDRWADTKQGRAYLLTRFPRAEVEAALAEVRGCYKSGRPDLDYEVLTTVRM